MLEEAEAAVVAAGSANDEADECAGEGKAGEKEGEGKEENLPPPPSSAAQPVKTLPRPVYDGDKEALIRLCGYSGSGDVDEARDLIARGINIDEQNNQEGNTALIIAVVNNRLEIVPELIRAGAVLDLQNNYGDTALKCAAVNNCLEIMQELIRAGAALDLQNQNENKTALMIAVTYDHLEIAQELIRAGAALDVQDNNGETALQIARKYFGRTEMATLLREAGASVG